MTHISSAAGRGCDDISLRCRRLRRSGLVSCDWLIPVVHSAWQCPGLTCKRTKHRFIIKNEARVVNEPHCRTHGTFSRNAVVCIIMSGYSDHYWMDTFTRAWSATFDPRNILRTLFIYSGKPQLWCEREVGKSALWAQTRLESRCVTQRRVPGSFKGELAPLIEWKPWRNFRCKVCMRSLAPIPKIPTHFPNKDSTQNEAV